jgi:Tfp pilus assembly PilM family ATPase
MKLPAFLQSPPPDVALAIESGHVAGARLEIHGGRTVIAAHAVEPLPAGAVTPSLASVNLPDAGVVTAAVRLVLDALGRRSKQAALVIPDAAVKVSLVRFDKVPARASDLVELVKWQVRKSAPFALEQARISFSPAATSADGGQEFVVTLGRVDILDQYEHAVERAGVHAGLVDLASFHTINGVLAAGAAPGGDWLLVYVAPVYTTLAVVRNGHVIFYRNRAAGDDEGPLADLVHQTAMYYEDRLQGGGFERVLLAGASAIPGGADTWRRSLEERLRVAVEPVDPRLSAGLTDRIEAPPELLDALAPLAGALLRDRKAA